MSHHRPDDVACSRHGELIDRLRGAVEAWPVPPSLVGLFGSAARRDGDAGSDIDVLIVSDDPELPDRVDELSDLIRRWTGNRAQVVGRTSSEVVRLRRAGEPILHEWTRDLLVVTGDRAVVDVRDVA